MSFGKYKNLIGSSGFQFFLWTQFLGAFNDNFFKIVLSMVAVNISASSSGGYVSMVGAIFILPFFLFSGYAGYIADAYNKRTVLIVTKSFEILAAIFGTFAFLSYRIEFMLFTLFLMSMHSTFFGPSKYGIIPEMLPPSELSRANGLLEMSTFLAIILGTSAGTIMYSFWKERLVVVGLFLIGIAVTGTVTSFGIPRVRDSGAKGRFTFKPWAEISAGLKRLYEVKILMLTVAAITYFWFLGSLLQMDILLLGKEVMGLEDLWVGILITFLAIGIGAGSITAGRLSGEKIEPGLVPLGSIGMGLFSILLAYSSTSYPRTAAALIMLGFSGGLFIVPLNAMLQRKSGPEEKGRLIATNNFVNTVGILLASGVFWVLRDILNIHADRILLIFGIATLFATICILKVFPDFFVRFVLWMLTHTLYKIRIEGEAHVPSNGPALIVCNHVSFVDGLLVGACAQRFIRFLIYRRFYELKPINWALRLLKAIPVSDGNKKEVIKHLAWAREELLRGHVVCIFAEGAITRTGNLLPFKKGFERIVEGLDVPVIPAHLDRVWGSIFSFKGKKFFWKLPSHFPYPVTVSFGAPMRPGATSQEVRRAVMELSSEAVKYRRTRNDMLHLRFVKTAKRRFFSFCIADSTGRSLTWGKALAAGFMLAGWLKRKRREDGLVGVLLPASVAGALANIAIPVAGKTSVNLNFTAGREAIAMAMEQCGIKTIITSKAFIAKAGINETREMVFLEDIGKEVSPVEKALAWSLSLILPSRVLCAVYCRGSKDPGRLATVIFTSGSAGIPKGVMLTHHNIISNVEGFSQIFHVTEKDTLMGPLPFFHSFGYTVTIWFPLISGFPAVYHSNPMDADTVGEMVSKYKATIIFGTPTFYSAYIRRCSKEQFASLRYAVSGAEKMPESIAEAFKEKFGISILEGYGCTEMAPVISVNIPDIEHQTQFQKGHREGTVGHPLPGVAVKVVDPEDHKELYGDEGLLMVKGPNLMTGYWGDPERTGNAIKDGWYVTGDIGSIGDDGFIRITDRISRFSKVAGEMVPHIKIEETLSGVLDGCDCAVTSVPDEKRGECIVAFYTRKDIYPDEAWERLAKTELPRLWLPRKENIHYIESLPFSGTGKIDLRKIKAMAFEVTGSSSGNKMPGGR